MAIETAVAKPGRVLKIWTPEDRAFWVQQGQAIATRNLWISVPALFLAFAVWQLMSVVAVKLPQIGFTFTTNQLFWLVAAPALSGATLRIFYSFMIPIFGGRRWTAISTASLLIPAVGIGLAVQDSTTSYTTMLVLALLCGFGGGNFSSSMANISFFFPKERKGSALGVNAGLGNLGVSSMQFLAPIMITVGILGIFGGDPEIVTNSAGPQTSVWIQNAAFIWVPWVRAQDENEIRKTFDHTVSVRKLGPQARELADMHFFETLVRIHRAGEGAPFTGLKPAGRDLGPAIPAADRALEDGSVDAVVGLVTDAVARGIRERFQAARSKRRFGSNDVEAGREYVEAYVPYIHFVERLYDIAKESAHGHHHEPEESVADEH